MPGLVQRVGVVFGGPSPEHDVSVLTGLQTLHALIQSGRYANCFGLYWSKTGEWFDVPDLEGSAFIEGVPSAARPLDFVAAPSGGFVRRQRKLGRQERLEVDAVLVCCHGGPGEDGSLQGAFDLAGICYSGPSALSAALGMDKFASGAIVCAAGLPSLPRVLLSDAMDAPDFGGPYIVKPRVGGSSIGIDVVADIATARARLGANVHLRAGAVLEPYRPDLYDLQIAVRSYPTMQLSEIERPERTTPGASILSYADKYVGSEGMSSAPRELPAKIDDKVADQLREFALRSAAALGVRGVARIDFLSNGTELFVNEVNTIPGSLSRYLFVNPPLAFVDLLADLLAEALERPAAAYSAVGADGSVLRSAGSIASKLG